MPALTSQPSMFAVSMLADISKTLLSERDLRDAPLGSIKGPARDEALIVIGPDRKVKVGGLIDQLRDGDYTYDLHRRDAASPKQFHLPFKKRGEEGMRIFLPGPGIFSLSISDALSTPRIDLLLAAVRPAESAKVRKFSQARALIEQWTEAYQGWPIDDLLRAYLKALAGSAEPQGNGAALRKFAAR